MRGKPKMLLAALLVTMVTTASQAAGDGAGELSLDRTAVATLIRYSTPSTIGASVPGFGEVTARLGPPRQVKLVEGGIEALIPFALESPSLSFDLDVRFVPVVEREHGIVKLVAERVAPLGMSLPGLDLKSLVPPVELPRTLGGDVAAPGGANVELTAFVQGVRVTDERLTIEFGLQARPGS